MRSRKVSYSTGYGNTSKWSAVRDLLGKYVHISSDDGSACVTPYEPFETDKRANPEFSSLLASGMLHGTVFPFIAMAGLGSVMGRTPDVGNTYSPSTSNSWSETCQKIANSVSAASAVYYARSLSRIPPTFELRLKRGVRHSINQL